MIRALRPRALGDRAPPAALDRLGHGARRAAVRRSATRCRSRSGFTPLARRSSSPRVLLGLVPLAFASAIVRYRLMDVEVIIKRALVYAAALAAIAAIYAVLLQARAARSSSAATDQRNPVIALLATLVVVLLSRPVKNAIQTGARSRLLPRSLRLPPRARRLRARPEQRSRSAPPERAAGAPRHRDAGRRSHGAAARAGRRRARRRVRRRSRTSASPASRRCCRARRKSATRLIAGPHADARRSAGAAPRSTRARSSSGATPGSTTSCRASRRKARLR